MEDCYNQEIDIERLSKEACFSPFHFLRSFRSAFGETPHQYLTRRRIDRARELLAHSGLSITDICFEVGYESLGSFSTLFRKETGRSPLEFRTRIFLRPQLRIPSCYARMFGIRGILQAD